MCKPICKHNVVKVTIISGFTPNIINRNSNGPIDAFLPKSLFTDLRIVNIWLSLTL